MLASVQFVCVCLLSLPALVLHLFNLAKTIYYFFRQIYMSPESPDSQMKLLLDALMTCTDSAPGSDGIPYFISMRERDFLFILILLLNCNISL